MSEFQTDSTTSMDTFHSSDEIASLRQQIWTLLVILLVVSGTFCTYLVRQVSYAHKDLILSRQMVANGEGMNKLMQGLAEYTKTHPDFAPILAKHGFTLNTNPTTPAK